MGLVLTYPLLSIPLHTIQLLTLPMIVAGLLAIAGSLLMAWIGFSLFRHLVDGYYAAVISTVFLAVTTGFEPMAMPFLRRFAEENGPGKPVPVILPLNAFYLFPWMVSLLTSSCSGQPGSPRWRRRAIRRRNLAERGPR